LIPTALLIAFSLQGNADLLSGLARRKTAAACVKPPPTHRADGKYDPKESSIPTVTATTRASPPRNKVLMDRQGPGVITHIWLTFLEPEPHPWAKNGSANHQEMLLRIYYDGNERPGVEAPVGDFFANSFGKRRG
jgi:hypothetical protein